MILKAHSIASLATSPSGMLGSMESMKLSEFAAFHIHFFCLNIHDLFEGVALHEPLQEPLYATLPKAPYAVLHEALHDASHEAFSLYLQPPSVQPSALAPAPTLAELPTVFEPGLVPSYQETKSIITVFNIFHQLHCHDDKS